MPAILQQPKRIKVVSGQFNTACLWKRIPMMAACSYLSGCSKLFGLLEVSKGYSRHSAQGKLKYLSAWSGWVQALITLMWFEAEAAFSNRKNARNVTCASNAVNLLVN
jgi:hypothetical protein